MAKQPNGGKPKPQPRPTEARANEEGIGRRPRLSSVEFELICERYAETGLAIASCEALGFNHGTVMTAIKDQLTRGDTTWQDLWDHSLNKFRESLTQAIVQRGRDGTPTKFTRDLKTGELVVTERTYSDRMLELAAKAYNPSLYRDYVPPAGALGVETQDIFADLTAKAKREIRAIIVRDLEEQRIAAKEGATIVEGEFTEVEPEQIEDQREEG